MSSKLLVAASVSLTQCAAVAEASLRGDPNQVGYAVDRDMSWQGWHHISGVPQWVTAWAFVALFVGIVSVFIKCGKEDFNLYPRDCLGYLTAFAFGLFCALPCLWPPACFFWDRIQKKIKERRERNLETLERRRRARGGVQESEPAVQDPEALPDYPDHPCYPANTILPYNLDQTTLPDYPAHTILPDHPDQTTLPDYTDNLSPSAPPVEFAMTSAAEIAAEEAAHTTEAAAEAAEAAAAALAASEAAADRLGENGCGAPPSYDAAMRGEF